MAGKGFLSILNNAVFVFILILALVLIFIVFQMKGCDIINAADDKGCVLSQGFAWSEARNECVKVYQDSVQMMPTVNADDSKLNAFLVFASDNSSVDIYMPNKTHIFLIKDNNSSTWKDNSSTYFLNITKNRHSLFRNNSEIYFLDNQ